MAHFLPQHQDYFTISIRVNLEYVMYTLLKISLINYIQ
jgi:hypothetical protein